MKKIIVAISSIFLLAIVLTVSTHVFAKETQKSSLVRIIHASPDAPAVDVFVDGEIAVENAPFKAVTDYLELSADNHRIEIYATGTKDEQDPVIQADVTTEAGKAYTAAAVNTVENIELVLTEDDLSLEDSLSKVRVGHFSPDAPSVNVKLKDGKTIFENIAFKDVTEFVTLEPNTYDLEVVTTEGETAVLDLAGTTFEKDTIYSVYAINTANNIEPLVVVYKTK